MRCFAFPYVKTPNWTIVFVITGDFVPELHAYTLRHLGGINNFLQKIKQDHWTELIWIPDEPLKHPELFCLIDTYEKENHISLITRPQIPRESVPGNQERRSGLDMANAGESGFEGFQNWRRSFD